MLYSQVAGCPRCCTRTTAMSPRSSTPCWGQLRAADASRRLQSQALAKQTLSPPYFIPLISMNTCNPFGEISFICFDCNVIAICLHSNNCMSNEKIRWKKIYFINIRCSCKSLLNLVMVTYEDCFMWIERYSSQVIFLCIYIVRYIFETLLPYIIYLSISYLSLYYFAHNVVEGCILK